MAKKLDQRLLKNLQFEPDGKRTRLADSVVQGLHVEVLPPVTSGGELRKTWRLRYRPHSGERKWITLGTWPATSVEQARSEARRIIGDVEKGADPAAENILAELAGSRLSAFVFPGAKEACSISPVTLTHAWICVRKAAGIPEARLHDLRHTVGARAGAILPAFMVQTILGHKQPSTTSRYAKLRCYVAIELKARPFEPGDGAPLGVYMHAVDKLLTHPDDKPTISLLLVRTKNRVLVEYALAGSRQPISVSQWETQLTQQLPEDMRGSLPSIEEIEAEMAEDLGALSDQEMEE